jgi:hypothetical protein
MEKQGDLEIATFAGVVLVYRGILQLDGVVK